MVLPAIWHIVYHFTQILLHLGKLTWFYPHSHFLSLPRQLTWSQSSQRNASAYSPATVVLIKEKSLSHPPGSQHCPHLWLFRKVHAHSEERKSSTQQKPPFYSNGAAAHNRAFKRSHRSLCGVAHEPSHGSAVENATVPGRAKQKWSPPACCVPADSTETKPLLSAGQEARQLYS